MGAVLGGQAVGGGNAGFCSIFLLLTAWMAAGAAAQSASGGGSKLPEFEVATIKPSNPSGGVMGIYTYPGGRPLLSEGPHPVRF